MNATTDSIEPPFAEVKGHHDYLFVAGFFFSVLLLFVIAYVSYVCKRSRSHPSSEFSFRTTVYDEADDDRLLRFSRGLDDDVLVTFPTFIYSDATIPHKGDVATDTKGSGCSICLADYKPADVVRLLPECSHLFHVKCIDTWLKAHPTCPVCRNSPHSGNLGKQRM